MWREFKECLNWLLLLAVITFYVLVVATGSFVYFLLEVTRTRESDYKYRKLV